MPYIFPLSLVHRSRARHGGGQAEGNWIRCDADTYGALLINLLTIGLLYDAVWHNSRPSTGEISRTAVQLWTRKSGVP